MARRASPWPDTLETQLYPQLDAARQSALGSVDIKSLLILLQRMPTDKQAEVASSIGARVRKMPDKRFARALAKSLAAEPSVTTVGVVFRPLRQVFYCNHLTDRQWAALLSRDWTATLNVLDAQPHFTWHLWLCEQVMPIPLFRAALAATTLTAPGRQVPSVAFLTVHDPALAEAYASVRKALPSLPEVKAAFIDLLPGSLAHRAHRDSDRQRVEQIFARARQAADEQRYGGSGD